jgi:hypothetical protein
MIEQPAVESVDGGREAACRSKVGLARPRIAARMVVREKDGRTSVPGRVDDDIAQRKVDSARIAGVSRKVKAASLLVEMRDPQSLVRGRLFGEAAGKEFSSGKQAVELQRGFGTLMAHCEHLAEEAGPNDANWVGFGA